MRVIGVTLGDGANMRIKNTELRRVMLREDVMSHYETRLTIFISALGKMGHGAPQRKRGGSQSIIVSSMNLSFKTRRTSVTISDSAFRNHNPTSDF